MSVSLICTRVGFNSFPLRVLWWGQVVSEPIYVYLYQLAKAIAQNKLAIG